MDSKKTYKITAELSAKEQFLLNEALDYYWAACFNGEVSGVDLDTDQEIFDSLYDKVMQVVK